VLKVLRDGRWAFAEVQRVAVDRRASRRRGGGKRTAGTSTVRGRGPAGQASSLRAEVRYASDGAREWIYVSDPRLGDQAVMETVGGGHVDDG
jgi:hypothetical protein